MLLVAAIGCGDDKKSVGVVADTLEIGQTDCGAAALPHVLVITNPGADPFTFTTSLANGTSSPYTISPDAGVVLGYAQLELTVYSKPIPQTADVTDNAFGDTLTITTTMAGDKPHDVAIHQTAHGVILQVSTPTVAFTGTTKIGAATQTQDLTITNAGNAAAGVTVTSDGESFAFTPGGAQMLAPGAPLTGQIAYSPRDVGAVQETLTVSVSGKVPLCAPAPTVVATGTSTLSGTAIGPAVPVMTKARARQSALSTVCVVVTGGMVACTGTDTAGLRGDGDKRIDISGFNLVHRDDGGVLDNVVELEAGRQFYCARRQGADVWCWGDILGLGHKGTGDPRARNSLATQTTSAGATSVSAAYSYTCVTTDPGGVMSCGGQPSGRSAAVSGWNLVGAKQVALTGGGGVAMLADGSVLSFGENIVGERGNPSASNAAPSPVLSNPADPTSVFTGVTQVAGSGGTPGFRNHHACALKSDGTVWCWGHNRHGQLGNNTTTDSNHPVQVLTAATTALTGVTKIAAANNATCAISGGTVYCWGRNDEGQLGTNGGSGGFVLAQATPITNAVAIAMRGAGACATLSTGAVQCWGKVLGANNTPVPLPAFQP
jgi:hypothetical protein